MPKMTGGQAIVECLIAHGVDTVFALPGIQLDALFNALHDAGDQIRVINCRHEQGAAYMASGYAQSTGKVGVYAVVPGPGFLNTTAALSTAYACNAPVLCLTGQIPSHAIGRGLGLLHEIPDQLGILRGLTKWADRIEHPSQVPVKLGEAFRQLCSGRPRPVGLETAMDVLATAANVEMLGPPPALDPPGPDAGAIEKAAAILETAERPMIIVGGGALHASAEIRDLAETLEAPVIAFRRGRGIMDDRHHLSMPVTAGNRLWADADAVIAIGTRLQMSRMEWGEDAGLKIIRIDIDPVEMTRLSRPTVGIVADARLSTAALLTAISGRPANRPSRKQALLKLSEEVGRDIAVLEPQISYLKAIRKALPDDGFLVTDLTQVAYASMLAFPAHHPRHYITAGYQGTLGHAFATGLGVKIANPDQEVVVITGDGGFLFTAAELATAVKHRIGLVTIVFNDNAYGNVKRMQETLYGGRVIASDLANPDFVAMAQSFGAQGLHAQTPDELEGALKEAFAEPGPTVIEVPVGDMPDPWHLIRMAKVRPAKA